MDLDNEEVQAIKRLNKKTDKLEEKYINDMKKVFEDYKDNNEALHYEYDNYLIAFLKEKGFEKIAKQYEKIRNENMFWYA